MAYRLAERLRDNAGSDRQELCGNYQLAQIRVGPPLNGKTLEASTLRERYGINVVLLTRIGPNGKPAPVEPTPDLKMASNDVMFVSGLRDKINRFEKECGVAG